MPGETRPVRTRETSENPPGGGITEEDLLRYEGMVIVSYQGKIRGVGRTLETALRRAKLPAGAVPYIMDVPPAEYIY